MIMAKEKWTILSRAKGLKNSTGQMGKVYISRDMSKEERARHYELRTLFAEERRSGEFSSKIRKGKLIKDLTEVGETEDGMVQSRNEEGDMRTGVRPKNGRFQREEGERVEVGMGKSRVGVCWYRIGCLNVQGLRGLYGNK